MSNYQIQFIFHEQCVPKINHSYLKIIFFGGGGCSEVEYLGHLVSASSIRQLTARMEAIRKFPQPDTAQQLQTYLGMVIL